MEKDIKVLEKYIENDIPCDSCRYCAERPKVSGAIRNLIKRVKDLEEIEQVHKEMNGELQKQLTENEADMTSVYLKGVYDERDKWKIKIKKILIPMQSETEKLIRATFIPQISSKIYNDNIEKYEPMLVGRNIAINALNKIEELLQE